MAFQAKGSRSHTDFRYRRQEVRQLVYALCARKHKDIRDVVVERGYGDFVIRIESSHFRSTNANEGRAEVHVTADQFWSSDGEANSELEDLISEALESL